MTAADKSKRRHSGETTHASLEMIEIAYETLIVHMDDLKSNAAAASADLESRHTSLTAEVAKSKDELASLMAEVGEKELHESMHMSQIYEAKLSSDIEQLVRDNITIPEAMLSHYWDHLKFRMEPAPTGGVVVTLGFTHASGFPDLRFVLQFSQATEQYAVSDCDPMIIGLSELLGQLNADSKAGALARFCCRLRARYTAQYSIEY